MRRTTFAAVVVLVAAIGSIACRSDIGPTATSARFRVINVGALAVEGLVVLFPGERLEFGNVPAGQATAYRVARKGVFRYGAYEFRAAGRVRSQPVTDWVGEEPMEGEAFSYSLELVEGSPSAPAIHLVDVRREE